MTFVALWFAGSIITGVAVGRLLKHYSYTSHPEETNAHEDQDATRDDA